MVFGDAVQMLSQMLLEPLPVPVRVAREAEGPRDLVVQLRHPPGRRDHDRRAREAHALRALADWLHGLEIVPASQAAAGFSTTDKPWDLEQQRA